MLRLFFRKSYHKDRISPSFFRYVADQIGKEFPDSIIFISLDELPIYLDNLDNVDTKHRVVLAGDSDLECTKETYEKMMSAKDIYFFVQNLNFPETSNVFLLPLGFEDPRWAKSGMNWNLNVFCVQSRRVNAVLVGPFRNTHPSREALLNLPSSSSLFVQAKPMAALHYARYSSQFGYIACPSGNGIDTHRLWETLKRGSIPVLADSPWARNVNRYIRTSLVSSWSKEELDGITAHMSVTSPRGSDNFFSANWWARRLERLVDSSLSKVPNQVLPED